MKDPPDGIRIWRFTDFAKFYAMLSSDTLYFSRLDALEDQFEGQFSEARVQFDEKVYEHPTMTPYGRSIMEWMHSSIRKNAFVNCWHMNEYESGLLWSKYSVVSGGIAIQSTSDRLEKSFDPASRAIYVSEIEYIDRAKDMTPISNVMTRAIQKGKSYQDEHELRAMYFHMSIWSIPSSLEALRWKSDWRNSSNRYMFLRNPQNGFENWYNRSCQTRV